MTSARLCARKGCRNRVTQAWDVGSWFVAVDRQKLAHYEVCDKHSAYFVGGFDRAQSEAVKRDLIEYDAMEAPHLGGFSRNGIELS